MAKLLDTNPIYYVYAYLRKNGTPYYIGKGKGNRMYSDHVTHRPPNDRNRIIVLSHQMPEREAFDYEITLIAHYGRKDLGTGILRNESRGGNGGNGLKRKPLTEEHKEKIRAARAKQEFSEEAKAKQREGLRKANKISADNRRGVPRSAEANAKSSAALKGRKKTAEHNAKVAAAVRGQKCYTNGIETIKIHGEPPAGYVPGMAKRKK